MQINRSPHAALYWFSPSVRVIVLSGRPDENDMQALTAAMTPETLAGPPYFSFVDVRSVDELRGDLVATFSAFIEKHRGAFSNRVKKSVIVHRGGSSAAIAAGYTRLLGDPFPSKAFTSPATAAASLGISDADGFVELLETVRQAAREHDICTRLGSYLSLHIATANLLSAAHALGLSERSLQRQLAENGRSFRQELERVRIERAQRLLMDDDKLLSIALDCGFSSAQSFSSAFKRVTGMRPSEWRKRTEEK